MCETYPEKKGCLINSVVSSRLLVKIAEKFNMRCEQTLTGFKWMGNKQMELEEEGYSPLLTYEEAIGYAVGGILRDKDGVSAAAKMCEIISSLHQQHRTLYSYLQDMYVVFYTSEGLVILPVGILLPVIVMFFLLIKHILIKSLLLYVIMVIICIFD